MEEPEQVANHRIRRNATHYLFGCIGQVCLKDLMSSGDGVVVRVKIPINSGEQVGVAIHLAANHYAIHR